MAVLSAVQRLGTRSRAVLSGATPYVDRGVARELRWVRAALGLCFLATLLVSYRAWLSSGRDFPLVPVIDGLPQPPYPLDWLLFGGMVAALLGMSFARRPAPYLAAVLVIPAVWMVLDQARWQPYLLTYLAGAACLLAGERPPLRAAGDPPARWHMAPYQLSLCAVYLYSGVHKLNLRWIEGSFRGWTSPITERLGIDPAAVPRAMFAGGVLAAAGEAALGLALLWPRTRRPAVVGLTLMHVYIMLALTRQGLAANTVVWPWNVVVVASLWLLFWPRGAGARLDGFIRAWWRGLRGRGTMEAPPQPLRLLWGGVIVLFGVLPALSFAEAWPAALSFQLYAAKQREVRIYYRPDQRAAMPPAALRSERHPGEIDLLRWGMRELNVVPALEVRSAIRVARELARRAPDAEVRVRIAGPPALRTGRREYREFVFRGPEQVPREVPATPGARPPAPVSPR
jgi:hypothetical protein